MIPTGRHMMFAALVSAVAWADAWINRRLRGAGYAKAYLFAERDTVLAAPEMAAALRDALAGTPDEGSTTRRRYHNWKDVWPTFLETARDTAADEEMASKYLAFKAASAGAVAGSAVTAIAILALLAVLGGCARGAGPEEIGDPDDARRAAAAALWRIVLP